MLVSGSVLSETPHFDCGSPFLHLGLWGLRRCCGQLQVIKQTKNWRLPRFCIGHFQTQKSSTDVEFWNKTCFYDFCGPRISTFFSFPFLCSSFLFPPKNNGFSTKKQSSPTNPTNPEFKWGPKIKRKKKSIHPPTNQTFNPIPTNLSHDLIFQHHDFHTKRRFRTAFSRWSLTTSTTCPVESLWGADSVCTAELVYSVLECSEFLTDKRNIQILGGWIVWKIT